MGTSVLEGGRGAAAGRGGGGGGGGTVEIPVEEKGQSASSLYTPCIHAPAQSWAAWTSGRLRFSSEGPNTQCCTIS